MAGKKKQSGNLLAAAKQEINQKNFQSALRKLDASTNKHTCEWTHIYMDCLIAMRRFDKAIMISELASEENIQLVFKKAFCFEQINEFKNAQLLLDTVLEYADTPQVKITALLKKAKIHQLLSEYDLAIELYQQALSLSSNELEIFLKYSECLLLLFRFKEAEQLLNEALIVFPNHARILAKIGRCYESNGHYLFALNIFDQAINAATDDATRLDILLQKSYCLNESNNNTDAGLLYQEILQLDPNNIHILTNYSNYLITQGMLDEANIFLSHASNVDRTHRKVLLCFAEYYEAVNDNFKAEDYYKIVMESFPHYFRGISKYGNFLKRVNPDKAIEFLANKLETEPNNDKLLLLKAKCHIRLKDYNAALDIIYAIKEKRRWIPEFYLMAIKLHIANDTRAAGELVEECLEYYPNNARLHASISSLQHLPKSLPPLVYAPLGTFQAPYKLIYPEDTQNEFNSLTERLGPKVFLKGGKVLKFFVEQIVKNNLEIETSDHDFIYLGNDVEALAEFGFTKNPFIPNLYCKFKSECKIDLIVIPDTQDAFKQHLEQQDFTARALIADRHGQIMDCTNGAAFIDIKYKRLRMMPNTTPIQDDPVRALTAVRLSCSDFQPNPELEAELKGLKVNEEMGKHFTHLFVVCKKHLAQHKDLYICKLDKYGLLNKIFGVTLGDSVNLAMETLEHRLEKPVSLFKIKDSNVIPIRRNKKKVSSVSAPPPTSKQLARNNLFTQKPLSSNPDVLKLRKLTRQIEQDYQRLELLPARDFKNFDPASMDGDARIQNVIRPYHKDILYFMEITKTAVNPQLCEELSSFQSCINREIRNQRRKGKKLYKDLSADKTLLATINSFSILLSALTNSNDYFSQLTTLSKFIDEFNKTFKPHSEKFDLTMSACFAILYRASTALSEAYLVIASVRPEMTGLKLLDSRGPQQWKELYYQLAQEPLNDYIKLCNECIERFPMAHLIYSHRAEANVQLALRIKNTPERLDQVCQDLEFASFFIESMHEFNSESKEEKTAYLNYVKSLKSLKENMEHLRKNPKQSGVSVIYLSV